MRFLLGVHKFCPLPALSGDNGLHCLPKLGTYILFKSEYCTENYLKLYLSRSHRSLLAQLRTGILPLRIETGRYQNILDKIQVNLER